jgi:hypothetical protein
VQIAEQDFFNFAPPMSFLPERHFTGTFTASGTSLGFDAELCDVQFNEVLRTSTVQYTATANSLVTISQQSVGPVMISYVRQ